MRRAGGAIAAVLLPMLAGGCALRSDVTKLRLQIEVQQGQAVRADSARAANLAAVARLLQSLIDSLAVQQSLIGRVRADLRLDLLNVQQQMVQIQELTGQSQQRLTEMRAQLDERSQQVAAVLAAPVVQPPAPIAAAAAPARSPGDTTPAPPPAGPVPSRQPPAVPAPAAAGPAPAEPTADQLMELSLQQLRRNSPGTARTGFAEFLRRFPQHARAADAEFFSGEAWAAEQRPDSAAEAYQRVVQRYAASPRAATALFRLGTRAQQANRKDEARAFFTRLTTAYPASDEAALARERLRALAPPR
jgi:tol-pal system protein YbgF